jgi:hypothetical protein
MFWRLLATVFVDLGGQWRGRKVRALDKKICEGLFF